MSRRESLFTATSGRDQGKIFKLTEMDAARAEDLCLRALFLLERAGIELPTDVQGTGAVGVALAGFKAFCQHVPFDDVKPILDEMWKCIEFIPNKENHNIVRPLFPNDIEEVVTRMQLRMEVFNLHMGFSEGEQNSRSTTTSTEAPKPPPSRTMSTSHARSAQSSVLAKRNS